ncbi:putative nuclear pore localization protein NPL4 [Helianthus annuus]|nr:putative nuclear pore localization protein NPL4 [Helianthus annuus]KAJ0517974.1 putative nuclear pore localization protein NPL4 [Helianthus annuus]KAJ0685993.1 putative nuclear pore localization protein NPL4 [Helianthus annuus]KAJ0689849.1 putative nuclear pore localization protein NPL4 [Helianthus annuus]
MLIRIRSRDGIERLQIDNPNTTIAQLKTLIESQLRVPINNQTLSTNQQLLLAKTPAEIAQFTDMSNPQTPIATLNITHGALIFLAYEGERTIAGPKIVPAGSFGRKMTMDDLIAKQMRIVRQESANCEVSFDRDAANGFQHYVNETLAFAVKRGGFMYGTVEDGKVEVDFIYEPPQQGTEESLLLLRDPDEEKVVEAIALGLGMRKLGFIFTQTVGQGKRDYTLSNREVLQAVELQAESEVKEWVTVVVKLEDGWFEGEIAEGDDPKCSKMNKDVVVGGKDTREVDNDFFLVVVKIFDHQGPLSSTFPVENRNTAITMRTLKNHLDRTKNLSFVKRISDFHLLLFIGRFLDVNSDVPALAGCVRAQATIPEGYQILIESMAASG